MKKTYKLFRKEISGPFTIPSGIVTTEVSTIERIMNEVPEIGIITTKSIGVEAREGNREPILAQYYPGCFINAVGLTNPGAEEFARKLSSIDFPEDKFLLASIFGKNTDEFVYVAETLEKLVDGFELNLSCPHAKGYGMQLGQDPKIVADIIKTLKNKTKKPIFPKLSPNLGNIGEIAQVSVNSGAYGIVAINTVGPGYHSVDGYAVLTNKIGGLSGRAITPIGLKCVREIREVVRDVPIISMGGIFTAKDIEAYASVGANFFGVGSALAGMKTEEIKQYFHELLADLENGTGNAENFLKDRVSMDYKKYKVRKNKQIVEDMFLLELDTNIEIEPGQFIFAWLPEKGEKPFSVFDNEPLTLLVNKKGYFTNELSKLNEHETIYIRGPYGKSLKINGKTLLVGGGTGIASLYLFAKKNVNKDVVAVLGAKDINHLPCIEKFKSACEVYIATENGEVGYKGLVTDNLETIIQDARIEYCINCGPEPMIKTAIQKEIKYTRAERIYSSIDFLTRCGVGLCGSCATSKGYRSCVDGTFLESEKV